jgi:hypothetical protein
MSMSRRGAAAPQHRRHRAQQQSHVVPHRPAGDVGVVNLEHLLEGDAAAVCRNSDLEDSHAIAAMVHKCVPAEMRDESEDVL